MLKESILFVASTGLLIYFLTPSDKAPETALAPAQMQETVKPAAQAPDDAWGYEEEADDENFVFGEPMTLLDDEDSEKPQEDEDRSRRTEQADNSGSRNSPAARKAAAPSPNSPRSGELGSLDNPIVFKTNNPENPVDD